MRDERIAQNNAFMRQLGIEDVVQTIKPTQPRNGGETGMRARTVFLKDVCVSGRYEQPCSGWVYDMPNSRYLKEAFKSQGRVLNSAVSALGVYRLNGLFRRYEVVRPLSEEVVTAYFMVSQRNPKSVYSTLIPDEGTKIFRTAERLEEDLMKYLKIHVDDREAGLLDIGNFKYCYGKGQMMEGEGLYIKYFKKDDFNKLRGIYSRLDCHYKFREESTSPPLPAGYYYHDLDDIDFSGQYNCIHVAQRNAHLRLHSESDDESRGYG